MGLFQIIMFSFKAVSTETMHISGVATSDAFTLNGLETYLAIKQINPKIISIIITGYYNEMKDYIDIAIANSTYTYLQKPLDIDFLLKLIDKILEKRTE